MNNSQFYRLCASAFILLVLLSFGVQSCDKKTENDPAEVAEEQNEAKFENSANEEALEDDASFFVDIAELNLTGTELGRLAQQKGQSRQVKDHGKTMEADHRQANNALNDLAARKGFTIPTELTSDGKDAYDKLNKADAQSFDNEYLDKMIKLHEEGIEEFEENLSRTQDQDIRSWAQSNVAEWRKHLTHTREIRDKLKK